MTNITEELRNIFGDRLLENEPLSKHTSFRVGGPARWFCDVNSVEELKSALDVLDNKVVYEVLGSGANVLVSDEGFFGVVFHICFLEIILEKNFIKAGAGVPMVVLARKTAGAGFAGLEWAVSLPGTVGGAIRGNAGCFGGEIKDNLIEVDVLRAGRIIKAMAPELKFGYRESYIKHSKDIILSATFSLKSEDVEALKNRMDEILIKRKISQPITSGTAGCTFKNYTIKKDDDTASFMANGVPREMIDNRRLSAGWLIDRAELKGEQIGGAHISSEHANFIINDGTASASDIVQLISMIKSRVRKKFNIQLEEEIHFIGL